MPAFSSIMHFLKEKQDEDSLEVMTFSQYYNLVYLPSYDSTHPVTYINLTTNKGNLPNGFKLLGNYPNPFNPSTTIKFSVENNTFKVAKIRIYNVLGELIEKINFKVNGKGIYDIPWNGEKDNGCNVSSGINA